MVVVDDEEEDDDIEDDDIAPICSVLVVLLWYSLFRVAFLPPVTDNGALINNNGALCPVEP